MSKPSLTARMKAGVAAPDKFAAAEAAMASGGLPATTAAPTPTEAAKAATPGAQFVAGSRVTEKATTGEGSIIRETYSLPPSDSALIDQLRQRTAAQGVMLNRSEILRMGLAALKSMDDASLATLGSAVPKMKTGRPRGGAQ
jgi:hypothetical protein